ncbi:RsmB/NOP family class I SAM-dependent RNA methyltransferase [Paenactinomyces guangxiensis]|uniref:RsmF rRNA methyltransferase first C-terminal domain-containing protein n=1 Tax=Paenactinomyces guangxiensis TaxID=1490290 RepID=A0A7W1WR79_9BACL|nr:RsmB/NOP family class I SAM-dependent RNA methyltransferase [Paenactinomyces guangxiensis]MBA4494592.1 RsmF rRNA methyltransferase first C-terminal domain-containing protein [Paenactinomyces guangxiensis]MBH8591645.1 RsmB/NOP family class I SAM-dependent RNA methyltransferase [Paenactinomyces guangxiensis]
MIPLPPDYLEQMKRLLGSEYSAFIRTYEQPPTRALRVNTLKITPEELKERVPFHLNPIPWCKEAFYYEHDLDRPGKHVYHAAGLYYIQDASAMAPAEALEPQPGEKVLDLCAAPGGKTTQIAAAMRGEGLLVANEIDGKRIKALVENLERCGVTNAVVLNENPIRLTARFAGFFDRILIDAPCSGEGMFRKDNDACERWSLRAVEKCGDLQLEILTSAAPMLRPGGRLVYSTCTFNPTENESLIGRFLKQHPEFHLIPVPQAIHYQPGRPDWMDAPQEKLTQAARLWPHHLHGEGHFVAVLEKGEAAEGTKQRPGKFPPVHAEAVKQLRQFTKQTYAKHQFEGPLTLYGEHLYQVPEKLPSLKGLKVERPGRYLGQVKKGRFVPSHALALSSRAEWLQQTINFSPEDPQLLLYLQGEALPVDMAGGWTLVTVDQFPLGWGKSSGGLLKNHYPKWLRRDKY